LVKFQDFKARIYLRGKALQAKNLPISWNKFTRKILELQQKSLDSSSNKKSLAAHSLISIFKCLPQDGHL